MQLSVLASKIYRLFKRLRSDGFVSTLKYIYHYQPPLVHPVQVCLNSLLKSREFTIIQIGAYIGRTNNDPLFATLSRHRKHLQDAKAKIILVEPIKEYFDQLRENYQGIPGVYFENLAISDEPGKADLYRLGVLPADYDKPDWLSQLSSLKRERHEEVWDQFNDSEAARELQQFYLEHRVKEPVVCITFEQLLKKHSIEAVDLLQMDVEGYEYEILKTIDFSKFPIRFLNYEASLLDENRKPCHELVSVLNYNTIDFAEDTFCYQEPDRKLFSQFT